MFKKISIEENQRAFLYKNGIFQEVLKPGKYSFFSGFQNITFEVFDINQVEFRSTNLDTLMKNHPDVIEKYFFLVDTQDHEIAVVYLDKKVYDLVSPGERKLYWKANHEVSVEMVNAIQDYEISREKRSAFIRVSQTSQNILYAMIPESHTGLLYVEGKLTKTYSAGTYAFWNINRTLSLEVEDTRLQQMEVSGQDLLTKDRMSLRVNLSCFYRVKDAVQARTNLANYSEYLYKELQFAIREAVGTQFLDDLLTDNKTVLNQYVLEYVQDKLENTGLEVQSIGVKDVILPGEMKNILNQVIEAKKQAEANLIKRREETAATRSLLNTAKLMENNPILIRLKELESLERITDRIDSLNVYNGLNGLMNNFVKLNDPQT